MARNYFGILTVTFVRNNNNNKKQAIRDRNTKFNVGHTRSKDRYINHHKN